ncbi:hypothetical protein [Stappia sp. ES.058]|uniref:hypothetical protein n=1 Tax=Stappia sp. ES.058 TaxID=1881061 RepID=UPI00087B3BD3|nr:hypothetical protein [Stappia sp. ES.058]SDT89359.1 hypothetical protein SAMN05428979_0150 [Stappia sp. ES.058]
MALKDLVADHDKITEERIEDIVSLYIRYDPQTKEIVFTPDGTSLSNENKVLVYLVGMLGWRYILDENLDPKTKPADLEVALGIAGGSLRPILKKLKDQHLLTVVGGHYAVRTANLEAIAKIISGAKSAPSSTYTARRTKPKVMSKGTGDDAAARSDVKAPKERKRTGIPIRSSLNKILSDGWFEQERSLLDVFDRLQEMAINAKKTSLSGPIADLVRDGKLTRKKAKVGKKDVWLYKAVSE